MSGYNRTAHMGNPQLSFPAVAMGRRTLGSAYINPTAVQSNDFEIGPDQYGFTRDANRMAMARVASTHTSQNVYDRQPRSVRFGKIIPDGHTSHPYGSTQDMGDPALRFWLNSSYDPSTGAVRGGGSTGALTTPEGQRYRRKILDARRDQLIALDAQQDTAPPLPTTEKDLDEVEANKVQIDLEFNQILDEVDSGIVERGTAGDFNQWARKFATTLPYYNRTDVGRLNGYMEGIYETLYRNAQVVADRTELRRGYGEEVAIEKDKALTNLLQRTTDTLIKLIKEYMKGIDLQLPERILLVKNILRRLGMEGLAKAVVKATPQAVANDAEDMGDGAGDDQDGGGAEGYAPLLPPPDDEPPVDIGEDQVPREGWEDLPQTQAQISARARQIVIDTGVNLNEATARVARAWSAFTRYNPRPNTNYKAMKRTLVERIKAYKRSLGGEGIDNLFRGLAVNEGVQAEGFPVGFGRPRLVGRRATGGRSVHHRLAATQEAKAIRRINEASRR